MKLFELFDRGMVRHPLRSNRRAEAIRELVDLLVSRTGLSERDALVDAIEAREKTGTTALGRRVAFPHARTHLTDRLYLVLGISPEGIEWGTGEPAQLVFLFVTPLDVTKSYIDTLAAISALLHIDGMTDSLVRAPDTDAVVEAIRRTDITLNVSHCARDVMVKEVISTGPGVPVRVMVNRLAEHNISGMPVIDEEGRVIGVVSEKDVLSVGMSRLREFFGAIDFYATCERIVDRLIVQEDIAVGDIMNRDAVCVDEETPITEIAHILVHRNIRRVPVVREGRLVGVVGRADILRKVIRKVGVR
ncbi:MAG: hypothetical protein CME06_13450 [Gemmatimonadetes bacterium]|nr:hypothetical protein [Gemmatimonadota bacterium]